MRPAQVLAMICGALLARAQADVGGRLQLDSNYLYRGVSLSGQRASGHLQLGYDAPGGTYLGAYASGVALYGQPLSLQLLTYAGYAQRLRPDLSVDFGATRVSFRRAGHYNYHEWMAGIGGSGWNARTYYSPAYFGHGGKTVYAEINGQLALPAALSLFGHLGILSGISGRIPGGRPVDARLGVAAQHGPWQVQLARVAVSRSSRLYPADSPENRHHWTTTLTYGF